MSTDDAAQLPESDAAQLPESTRRREERVRRAAGLQGFRLQKSRRRDPQAPDFGKYWLLAPATGTAVTGDDTSGFGMTLDEVESALATGVQEKQAPLP